MPRRAKRAHAHPARVSTAVRGPAPARRRSPTGAMLRPSRARDASIRRTSVLRSRPRERRIYHRRRRRPRAPRQSGRLLLRSERQVRSSAPEPPFPRGKGLESVREGLFVEVGPECVEKKKFGVSGLPEQKIGQAYLAGGADQEVELGKAGGLQFGVDGVFVNRFDGSLARC